jgi:hypothetical protein
MKEALDYTREYKSQVRPEMIKRIRNILLSGLACVLILIIVSKSIDFLELPFEILFVFAFPLGIYYVCQILSLEKIRCPNCEKPLFFSLNIKEDTTIIFKILKNRGRNCPHCNAKFFRKNLESALD